jgi:hypothetical protein
MGNNVWVSTKIERDTATGGRPEGILALVNPIESFTNINGTKRKLRVGTITIASLPELDPPLGLVVNFRDNVITVSRHA